MVANKLFRFFTSALFFSMNLQVHAQEVKISGRITAFNTYGLNQVAISVKGSGATNISDSLGYFTIKCMPDDKLIYEAKGFHKKTIKLRKVDVSDSLNINLELRDMEKSLEMATGYGHIEKDNLTHAIEKAETTNDYSEYASILDIIKGRVSGVHITGNSITIRGNDTYNDGEPLIVVDGAVMDFISLNNISTSQVKSVDVLKGASASARYGSRGMQGVIVIRTKMNQ